MFILVEGGRRGDYHTRILPSSACVYETTRADGRIELATNAYRCGTPDSRRRAPDVASRVCRVIALCEVVRCCALPKRLHGFTLAVISDEHPWSRSLSASSIAVAL